MRLESLQIVLQQVTASQLEPAHQMKNVLHPCPISLFFNWRNWGSCRTSLVSSESLAGCKVGTGNKHSTVYQLDSSQKVRWERHYIACHDLAGRTARYVTAAVNGPEIACSLKSHPKHLNLNISQDKGFSRSLPCPAAAQSWNLLSFPQTRSQLSLDLGEKSW